ncbi:MAG: Asp-tRNA(Asn)/Glu-tRNA(Gln) amidotransferase subunit GatA [bacterium]|nr:Asp-tRNA(Asn)/Glu-tRNA(Gln) amidotransferase subunit GatA [bacterium]
MKTPRTIQESLDNIQTWEPHVNAFLELCEVDQEGLPADVAGLLQGLPIAVKANIATTSGHTNASSKILKNFKSPFNATALQRLLDAGVVVVGKTQEDEFGMGASSENNGLPPQTKNPWDVSRVAGGSSGGSAAAVASGEVFMALGTDTGGSVRQPASFCGVVGVKPTYGRVSRHGLLAYGSSLDQAGVLTRRVADAAHMLEIMAGQDVLDATSSPERVGNYVDACKKDIAGLKIGMPKEFFAEGIDPEVKTIVQTAIYSLENVGAIVQEISLPLTPAAIAVYYLIAKAEASSNLARFDGLRYETSDTDTQNLIEYYKHVRGFGFGEEVKRAILMGTYALSSGYVDEWYGKASKVRTLIRKEYEEAFQSVDAIACPVSPEAAFPLGSKSADPLAMYLADAYTVPMSVAGLPAMSVPCGMTKNSLPVGLQIIASHFKEERMFSVASAYENAQTWKDLTPTLPK